MNQEMEVEVFRAGDYGEKGVWNEAALDQIAADYDPALHEAPVTLDHAQSGPALGWVETLRRVGDRLVARLRGLNGRLLDLLRQGAFKKRSVELYPALRETGRPYVRAVSFLGAAVPEVKGLADPIIGEGAGAPLFQDAPEASLIFEESCAPAEPLPSPTFVAFEEVADRLRQRGRWHPAWGERGIGEFYRALAAVDEIEVGEGQCVSPAEWFASFLESLPPVIALGEEAPANNGSGLGSGSVTFAQGANVDPASLTLHRDALHFQQANPGISYAEALVRCSSGR